MADITDLIQLLFSPQAKAFYDAFEQFKSSGTTLSDEIKHAKYKGTLTGRVARVIINTPNIGSFEFKIRRDSRGNLIPDHFYYYDMKGNKAEVYKRG
ncbi:MAG: hypothetical protein V1866_05940 [archaeon]